MRGGTGRRERIGFVGTKRFPGLGDTSLSSTVKITENIVRRWTEVVEDRRPWSVWFSRVVSPRESYSPPPSRGGKCVS